VGRDGIEPPTPGFSDLVVIGLYARVLKDLRLSTPWPTSRRVAAHCTLSRGVSDTLSDSGPTSLKGGRATQDAGPNDESLVDCRGLLRMVRKYHLLLIPVRGEPLSAFEQREATGVRMALRRGLETRVRFPNGIWLSGVFAAGPFEGLAMVP
jgi:hypothetical protein